MTTAIILAGGLGTRLRSVVPDLPKPMAEVAGKPFLSHLMSYWLGQGVDKFVLSVGYKKETIINEFGDSFCGANVSYVEEIDPLGTGGALLLASRGLTDPFLLMNGDTLIEINFERLKRFHEDQESKWTMALFRANEEDRYGAVECDGRGSITGFSSQKCHVGETANAGVSFIDPSVLEVFGPTRGQKCSLEDDLIPELVRNNVNLMGLTFSADFIDIGLPKDFALAQDRFKGR